jgi:hypothetical protein
MWMILLLRSHSVAKNCDRKAIRWSILIKRMRKFVSKKCQSPLVNLFKLHLLITSHSLVSLVLSQKTRFNPLSTKNLWLEQWTHNPLVQGSNPSGPSIANYFFVDR